MAIEQILTPGASLAMTEDRPAAVAGAVYALWAVFWALMVVVAIQDQLHDNDILWWEPLLWEGSSALGATFWLVMQRRAAQRYEHDLGQPVRWFAQHLKWMPLLVATFVPGVYAVRHGVYSLVGKSYLHEPWSFVFVYESVKLLVFAGLWLGILFGFSSFARWRHERQRLLLLQKSLAEAQLSQLKAQLRPHFLFNALNTISSLMHADVERADRLLARLSELLRSTLQSGDQERVALGEELRVLELYAQIMQERFAERVAVHWMIEPAVLNAEVPALLLQPLLENAFKHGVEKSREPVVIEVRGSREDDAADWPSFNSRLATHDSRLATHDSRLATHDSRSRLLLRISNSGTLEEDLIEGVGLRNCRERLRVMYGETASFSLGQAEGFVVVHVALPFRDHDA